MTWPQELLRHWRSRIMSSSEASRDLLWTVLRNERAAQEPCTGSTLHCHRGDVEVLDQHRRSELWGDRYFTEIDFRMYPATTYILMATAINAAPECRICNCTPIEVLSVVERFTVNHLSVALSWPNDCTSSTYLPSSWALIITHMMCVYVFSVYYAQGLSLILLSWNFGQEAVVVARVHPCLHVNLNSPLL